MLILGISAFYHDSAAALIRDGVVLSAAQQERFSRIKNDAAFPHDAVAYCLAQAGIGLNALDYVAFYEKPFLKFERLLETYLAFAPRGLRSFTMALPLWLQEKLFLKRLLTQELSRFGSELPELLFAEHHQSHAASAFFPSPFEEAAVLTLDGVGEWATTTSGIGRGNDLWIERQIDFPHSLGLLYSAFTYHAGFQVNEGEYKLMGLAPYGRPRFTQLILNELIDVKGDGSFRLNLDYFDYCVGLTMTNKKFDDLVGCERREPEGDLSQRYMDLAASVQQVVEEVLLRLTRDLHARTGLRHLAMAGGVALNCVANGRILRDGRFDRLWIQPAAGDAGGAVGAALAVHHQHLGEDRQVPSPDGMSGAYLGPSFDQRNVEERLAALGVAFEVLPEEELLRRTTDALVDGAAVGWFQGRMEFGPRALGNRSILADPRSPKMQRTLNLKVKFRESFRPFAPAVLRTEAPDWFDLDVDSPYMLLVAPVADQHLRDMSGADQEVEGLARLGLPISDIPAVTHVDGSARIQTVDASNGPYHRLLVSFFQATGCPVLVNTSFNVRGEPIVCTPEDAYNCFAKTDLDVLVVGNCFVEKAPNDRRGSSREQDSA